MAGNDVLALAPLRRPSGFRIVPSGNGSRPAAWHIRTHTERASIRPGILNCERAPIAAIDVVARDPRFADNYRGKPFTILRDRACYG